MSGEGGDNRKRYVEEMVRNEEDTEGDLEIYRKRDMEEIKRNIWTEMGGRFGDKEEGQRDDKIRRTDVAGWLEGKK